MVSMLLTISEDLFSVFLLNPSSDMQAPRDWDEQGANDVLRIDSGRRQLVEDIGFVNKVCSCDEGGKRGRAEDGRRDLVTDTKNG